MVYIYKPYSAIDTSGRQVVVINFFYDAFNLKMTTQTIRENGHFLPEPAAGMMAVNEDIVPPFSLLL